MTNPVSIKTCVCILHNSGIVGMLRTAVVFVDGIMQSEVPLFNNVLVILCGPVRLIHC